MVGTKTISRNALSHVPFRAYLLTSFISSMGLWMERLAFGWLAWQLTESTFWTGFITLASIAPAGIFGPFFAVFAERWHERTAIIVLNIMSASVSAIAFILVALDLATVPVLAALSLTLGTIAAFNTPIRLIVVSSVVPQSLLPSAIGLTAMGFNTSRVLGPAAAGGMILAFGLAPTFLANVISFIPFILVMFFLPLRARERTLSGRNSMLTDLAQGVRYIGGKPIIGWALLITALNGLFVRSVLENIPAVVGGVFRGDSGVLAMVSVAAGVGTVLGAYLVSVSGEGVGGLVRFCRYASPLGCGAIALLGLAPPLPYVLLLTAFGGCCATLTGIGAQAIIQLSVDENYKARTLSWWSTLTFGALGFGGMALSALGEIWPMGWIITGFAILGLLLSIALARSRLLARADT